MNQWAFVTTAYGVTITATLLLVALSWLAMRRAERSLDAVTRRP